MLPREGLAAFTLTTERNSFPGLAEGCPTPQEVGERGRTFSSYLQGVQSAQCWGTAPGSSEYLTTSCSHMPLLGPCSRPGTDLGTPHTASFHSQHQQLHFRVEEVTLREDK